MQTREEIGELAAAAVVAAAAGRNSKPFVCTSDDASPSSQKRPLRSSPNLGELLSSALANSCWPFMAGERKEKQVR